MSGKKIRQLRLYLYLEEAILKAIGTENEIYFLRSYSETFAKFTNLFLGVIKQRSVTELRCADRLHVRSPHPL